MQRKLHNLLKRKKTNFIIIGGLLISLMMAVAYSVLIQSLTISGTSTISTR